MEKIFVTMSPRPDREKYFPEETIEYLKTLGSVSINEQEGVLTEEDLIRMAPDATILVTHWGCPQITEKYLAVNPDLKVIAHCAGTVAHTASEATYQKGIPCLSANDIMSIYVAEGVLGHLIYGTHCFMQMDREMEKGIWNRDYPAVSLLDGTVGLIGLGSVARHLLDLMAPLYALSSGKPGVKVYDPYMKEHALDPWPFAVQVTLEEVLGCDAVSLHAAQTPETYHMIGEKEFSLMKDNALFINTARGSLVDTAAARKVLSTGRIRAIFDVYEKEWCPQEDLMGLPNVTLNPHAVGMPAGASMTWGVIKTLPDVLVGKHSPYEVSYETWCHMTQE